MSAFEFFFSFYGLLLGLSAAVIATGLATAIQHRKTVRIGRLTPALALFVALDIASFWDGAWVNFRHLQFSYGMLVAGLAIAVIYFVAASLVFPHRIEDGDSLDEHFWENRRPVLILMACANVAHVVCGPLAKLGDPALPVLVTNFAVSMAVFLPLILSAAFVRRSRTFLILIGALIVIYLLLALSSVITPQAVDVMLEDARATAAAGAPQ